MGLIEIGGLSAYVPTSHLDNSNNVYILIPVHLPSLTGSPRSSSRCSTKITSRQIEDFQEPNPTSGSMNECKHQIFTSSSAQKLVVNIHAFFTKFSNQQVELTGSPIEMTGAVTSLNPKTVSRVITNSLTGVLETPGGRRQSRKRKECQLYEFNVFKIKDIIQGFYRGNKNLFFADIYTKFMEAVRHDEEQEILFGAPDMIPFKCSPGIFRKVLRRFGYYYGRIETRDAILMRPDIVA